MKWIWITVAVIIAAATIWSIGQWIYLQSIEKLEYTVLEQKDGYEIRQYPAHIVATTTMKKGDDNGGFNAVGGYIFGANTAKSGESESIAMTTPVITQNKNTDTDSEQIAMTAPVLVTPENNNSQQLAMTAPVIVSPDSVAETMSFVMPAEYTLDNLPTPTNDNVTLKEIPAQKWAVLKYSWSRSQTLRDKKEKELLKYLKRDSIENTGEVQFAFFDPPTTLPFLLKNEVWVKLK